MASLLLLIVLCIHQCTANRLLLQTPVTPNIYGFIPSPTMNPTHPPPGEQIGAYGQTCKTHSGRMQCGDPGQSNQISLPPFQRHIDAVYAFYISQQQHHQKQLLYSVHLIAVYAKQFNAAHHGHQSVIVLLSEKAAFMAIRPLISMANQSKVQQLNAME